MKSPSPDNGGPAFPSEIGFGCVNDNMHQTGGSVAQWYGMALRDYFAVHSTQPGASEIAKAAGVGMDSNHRIYPTAEATGMLFSDWWNSLTLERQCDLCARVRFAQADAMLRAREAA